MKGFSKGTAGISSPSCVVLGLFLVGALFVRGVVVVVILRILLLCLLLPLHHLLHTVAANQVDWAIALDIITLRKIYSKLTQTTLKYFTARLRRREQLLFVGNEIHIAHSHGTA